MIVLVRELLIVLINDVFLKFPKFGHLNTIMDITFGVVHYLLSCFAYSIFSKILFILSSLDEDVDESTFF